jgi:hypothetical protein
MQIKVVGLGRTGVAEQGLSAMRLGVGGHIESEKK